MDEPESVEERMRQFTIVAKYAMQTGQTFKRGNPSRQRSLRHIATEAFDLTHLEYDRCYHRAEAFIWKIRHGLSSEDMIKASRFPSKAIQREIAAQANDLIRIKAAA